MKNLLKTLCVVSVFLVAGCNMFRPDTRADLTRYEVFVEVDGKPYKISRTIQNWTTYGWDTNQGSSQGRRSDYGTFGQKIHDKQAIVIQFAPSYNSKKAGWIEDEKTGIKTLSNKEYLKRAFKILLLDHYKNPQVIEMYNKVEAFESPDARVRVTGTTRKKIPKIPFWPFQGDGKDRYYDYGLKGLGGASKNAKNFETRYFNTQKVSDDSIERILSEFPEIKNSGIYRLEGKYIYERDGKYKSYKRKGYRGSRIASLISQYSSCIDDPEKYKCHSYMGEKINNKWVMFERKFPIKIYYESNPILPSDHFESFTYEFELNGKTIEFKKDPEYRNGFLNFNSKEYYSFYYGYYHTREHKQK